MNKEKFDKLFMKHFWKIIVASGYLIVVIIILIVKFFFYEIGILEFVFLTVLYVAFTWQVFIERGD